MTSQLAIVVTIGYLVPLSSVGTILITNRDMVFYKILRLSKIGCVTIAFIPDDKISRYVTVLGILRMNAKQPITKITKYHFNEQWFMYERVSATAIAVFILETLFKSCLEANISAKFQDGTYMHIFTLSQDYTDGTENRTEPPTLLTYWLPPNRQSHESSVGHYIHHIENPQFLVPGTGLQIW